VLDFGVEHIGQMACHLIRLCIARMVAKQHLGGGTLMIKYSTDAVFEIRDGEYICSVWAISCWMFEFHFHPIKLVGTSCHPHEKAPSKHSILGSKFNGSCHPPVGSGF
jgi:hypothetical protein